MSLSSKILIFVGALVLLIVGGVVVYKQFEISARQDAIEKQVVAQKELADGITRAMAQYATKQDIDNMAKDNNVNLKTIQDDLKKLNASITAINVVTTKSLPQVEANVSSTGTQPGSNVPAVAACYSDPNKYQQNTQKLSLNEMFTGTDGKNLSIPFGEVGFSAWQDKPWNYNTVAREYKSVTVLGTDENQRQYAYSKFSIGANGKDYDVKIGTSTFKQEYPDPKFSFFNPRLYLGVDGGINLSTLHGEAAPNVSVQLMSYGKYKTQPDLSILQVGAGYNIEAKKPSLSLTPIMYNVGKHLPLMNNLYIGPSIQVSTAGEIGIMGGIKVGL